MLAFVVRQKLSIAFCPAGQTIARVETLKWDCLSRASGDDVTSIFASDV